MLCRRWIYSRLNKNGIRGHLQFGIMFTSPSFIKVANSSYYSWMKSDSFQERNVYLNQSITR